MSTSSYCDRNIRLWLYVKINTRALEQAVDISISRRNRYKDIYRDINDYFICFSYPHQATVPGTEWQIDISPCCVVTEVQ